MHLFRCFHLMFSLSCLWKPYTFAKCLATNKNYHPFNFLSDFNTAKAYNKECECIPHLSPTRLSIKGIIRKNKAFNIISDSREQAD